VSRPNLPFTAIERARARAVVDLATAHAAAAQRLHADLCEPTTGD
jgi:hypothetical protein